MYTTNRNNNGKVSTSLYLAESYRDKGKVKHRLFTNITNWPEELITQLRLVLKGGKVKSKEELAHKQGKAIGAIYVIQEICKSLCICKSLGNDRQGKLALLQIIGRIITQGSRLYIANEWSQEQAIEELLGISNYNEDTLYTNLDWLSDHQSEIEKALYKTRKPGKSGGTIFLYDVSSSYLEGTQNEYAEYGYNRDGKKGKKQIVYGLLCDEKGYPVSIEIFKGNTNDQHTVQNQLLKLRDDFGVEKVVFVCDKGMIKSLQIESIQELQWYYLTSITKPQIKTLMTKEVIQLSMFDDKLNEIEYEGLRYILRRNPYRAEEIGNNREERIQLVLKKISLQNTYLKDHLKASPEVSLKKINGEIKRRKLTEIIIATSSERTIHYSIDPSKEEEQSLLDGCYVMKTNVLQSDETKEILHDRYKDLALVETSFRTLKTGFEEVRPVYVRKEERTNGHVFVCMLSYMVLKHIWDKCRDAGYTLKYIIETLDKIQFVQYKFEGKIMKVLPEELSETQNEILRLLKIKLPREV
ncbi:MAG: IS1634 family transposase [Bacteroidia bacterium]|nr:IS1634 family transposase [Bacteroidia bacterium]